MVAKKLDSTYSPGPPQPLLDQGQEQAARATRGRRLAAGEGARGAPRRPAGRLLRRRRDAPLCRARGHRLRRKERSRLERLLAPLARERSPFEGKRGPRGAQLRRAAPGREVEFTEWTNDGVLRHPSYKGLVDDGAGVDRDRRSRPRRSGGAPGGGGRRQRRDHGAIGPVKQVGPQGGRGDGRGQAPAAHEPRQGHVSEDRLHEARPDRLLRANRPGAAASPARPPADAEALPRRRRGPVLLREAMPLAPARLGTDGGGLEPPQRAQHRLLPRQRRADARVAREPRRHRAAHLARARPRT